MRNVLRRPEGLIAARAAMGVGAAVIFPTTQARRSPTEIPESAGSEAVIA